MRPIHRSVADGVELLSLPDDRFKTMQLTVALLLPLAEDTAAAYALIPYLLRRGCAAYPDYAALQRRLDTLYGAAITASVGRIGETQVLTLNAVSLRDALALEGEPLAAECAALLCQMLFDPALEDGLFRTEDVEQEKRCLIELIDSEINQKRVYARHRCEELICSDEPYAVPRLGRAEQVAALTREALTAAWREMLKHARIRIILQGGDEQAVTDAFRRGLSSIERQPVALPPVIQRQARVPAAAKQETMDINQSKLVMGFRLPAVEPEGDAVAARVMNALFGGTPHSLLFRHVRERLSLCYYCVSNFDYRKGILLVDSGVALDRVDEAKAEILRQLDYVRRGDFSDEDLASAKRSLISALESVEDLQESRCSYYLMQSGTDRLTTPEDLAQAVAAVTRERVMAAAQRTALDGVYLLAEQGGETV